MQINRDIEYVVIFYIGESDKIRDQKSFGDFQEANKYLHLVKEKCRESPPDCVLPVVVFNCNSSDSYAHWLNLDADEIGLMHLIPSTDLRQWTAEVLDFARKEYLNFV